MTINQLFSTSVLWVLPLWLAAQPAGLILEDSTYQSMPFSEEYESLEERGALPVRKSLRRFCPTPGNQGNINSCVGWALANALTITRAIRETEVNKDLIDQMAHSASYIYNQVKASEDCEKGALLSEGLSLLKRRGDCLALSFPNSPDSCHESPGENHHRQAAQYAISRYSRLFKRPDHLETKIDVIRSMLANDKPVVIGMFVPSNFKEVAYYPNLNWTGELNIGHALVIVGYDDVEEKFEILNSYGANWGDRGFFKLGYYTLAKVVIYGYEMEVK